MIGFVGLVVPHILHLFIASVHRKVLPVGVLFGTYFMVVGSCWPAPSYTQEMPIGVHHRLHRCPGVDDLDPPAALSVPGRRRCVSTSTGLSVGHRQTAYRRPGRTFAWPMATSWVSSAPTEVASPPSSRLYLPGPPTIQGGQVLLDGADLLAMRAKDVARHVHHRGPGDRRVNSTSPCFKMVMIRAHPITPHF